jgi:hypothetical protein
MAEGKESKELRGKPLERLFWQTVSVENIDEIRKLFD